MATQYQSIDPKLVAKNAKKPVPMVQSTPAPVLQSLEVKSQQPQAQYMNINPIGSSQPLPGVGLSTINKPIESAVSNFTPAPAQQVAQPTTQVNNQADPVAKIAGVFKEMRMGTLTPDNLKDKYPELVGKEKQIVQAFKGYRDGSLTPDNIFVAYPELQQEQQPQGPTMFDQAKSDLILGAPARVLGGTIETIKGAGKGLYEGLINGGAEAIKDIKDTRNDPRKSIGEKIVEIPVGIVASKFLGGAVGDVVGGAIAGAAKGGLTNKEQEIASKYGEKALDFVKKIAGSQEPGFISEQYNKLSDLNKERVNDWVGYGIDALNLVGVGEVAGPAIKEVGAIARGLAKAGGKQELALASKYALKEAPTMADTMLTNMNRLTKNEQEKFLVQQGKTVGQFLNEKGIVSGGEKSMTELSERFLQSKARADAGLEAIQGTFKNDKLTLMLDDATRFAEDTLDPQVAKLQGLQAKNAGEGLTMLEINEVKRYFERNNKFTYGKDITAGEKTVRATNIDNAVREFQFEEAAKNGFGNLKEINKETQGYKYILDKLIKNDTGKLGNNAVSLTDWIVMSQVPLTPASIGLLVGKKVASSNRFRSNVVKLLNKINGHVNIADKAVDYATISAMQDEKALNKYLALPLKNDTIPLTNTPLRNTNGNPGVVKTPGGTQTPKPTVKTPISIREIGTAKNPGTTKGELPVPKKEVVPVKPKVDTMKNMTELDTNPQYQKQTLQDTNYKRNVKGLQTEYGTIENVKYDSKYNPQEFTIDGVKYPAGEVNNFWKKLGSYELKVNALSNKNAEIRSKLQAIRNGKENKVSGPQLRIVMEDLGIKSIKDIPDESLQTILDMSRKQTAPKVTPQTTKNNAPTPKANVPKPKLGRETLEQPAINDNLIQEAKKYKSADEFLVSKAETLGYKERGTQNITEKIDNKILQEWAKVSDSDFVDTVKQVKAKGLSFDGKNGQSNSAIIYEMAKRGYGNIFELDSNRIYPAKGISRNPLFIVEGDKLKSYNPPSSELYYSNQYTAKKQQLKQIREQANKKPIPLKGLGKEKLEQNITTTKPIPVYRGEGKGIGNSTFVDGKYFADSEKFASTFGEVTKSEIPAGSKIFDFDVIKNNANQKAIPPKILNDKELLTQYLIDKGYTATKNTNTRGVEYVLLNAGEGKLINKAKGFDNFADFKASIFDDWDSNRDMVNEVGKRLNGDKNPTAPSYMPPVKYIRDKAMRMKNNPLSLKKPIPGK